MIRLAPAAIAAAYRLVRMELDLRDPKLVPMVERITRNLGSRPRRQAAPAVSEIPG